MWVTKKDIFFLDGLVEKLSMQGARGEKKQAIIQGYMNAFAKSAPRLSIDSAALL